MLQAVDVHCASGKSLLEALRSGIQYSNNLACPVILNYMGKKIPVIPGDIVEVVLDCLREDFGSFLDAASS
ncbi:hypothetical protein EBE87_02875 [Pseudoroseomonas wenyumeiae]|uniref:Uncharacterized protein n=1 Tax=Teichococcus wenyumeiae TaxID=2478470 RepID=A0A3A9JG25_9PROT|nr:hypothetical protein [Pseudoroseomonas wenyumeiae]RKK04281.1 hypothetical protein D6Z83_10100 [Pseudoroseomonas wenyumeiae]RMI27324.1 hypothetical protein EBE87_02875 [Pseudoroseomonas wenyumeiae]